MSKKTAIRRSQVIRPWGVGAMLVDRDGTSLLGGALDAWFDSRRNSMIQEDEFRVQEWRLSEKLKSGVFHASSGLQVECSVLRCKNEQGHSTAISAISALAHLQKAKMQKTPSALFA